MCELLQDPYEYRTIARVLEYGAVAAFFALSTILFIDFLILLLLLVTTPRQLSWCQQVSVLCFALVCAFVSAYALRNA
jgi:NADH:ubiquinone oxidoreductase subunit 3 (subunit A)